MRLTRIILAGLAPLVSLSALADLRPAHHTPSASRELAPADLPRLFQAVVPLLICAADSVSTAAVEHPSTHAILTLESLWLLASFLAVPLFERRHQRTLLRC